MISCIVNSTRPISGNLSAFLYRQASHMAIEELKRLALDTSECYGSLYTEGKYASLGTFSGVIFTAEVVADGHDIKVEFLVRIPDTDARAENYHPGTTAEIRAEIEKEARSSRRHLN
jgi:hypothetical protein